MIESIVSLVVATALLLGSPGPAPLSLAAVGATFGLRKGLPFLFGILSGLAVVIVGASVGMVTLFSVFPGLKMAVQIVGLVYILYVALKIAKAPVLESEGSKKTSAPSWIDGFLFNLLNPKAYAAFFALFSQFLLPYDDLVFSYISTAVLGFVVAVVVDVAWLILGSVLRPLFESPIPARIMRITFALLMVVAVSLSLFNL